MWQRNNGRAEEELQIKFTGYLIQAVRRTQRDYLKALYAYSNQETLTDTIFAVSQTLEQEVMERLPLWEKIESSALPVCLETAGRAGTVCVPGPRAGQAPIRCDRRAAGIVV